MHNDFELLDMILENDEVAYTILLDKYKPIIYAKSRDYYNYVKNKDYSAVIIDDFIVRGIEAFDYAVKYFDQNKGYLFFSYFLVCLNSNFNVMIRGMLAKKNRPLLHYQDLDFEISDSKLVDPYDNLDSISFINKFKDYLYNLDLIDWAILELRFNEFKYREISCLLDVSSTKISRVVKKAKEELILNL